MLESRYCDRIVEAGAAVGEGDGGNEGYGGGEAHLERS